MLPEDVWKIIFSGTSNEFRFRCQAVSKHFQTLVLGTLEFLYLVRNCSPIWSASHSKKCSSLKKLSVISSIGPHREICDEWILPLTTLNTLRIPNNFGITDAALKPLIHLHTLVLRCAGNITDHSLKNLTNLTHLDLSRNWLITDTGLEKLTQLKYLDLSRNRLITNSAVSKLVSLDTLILDDNYKITDSAIYCLTNLTRIELWNNMTISLECLFQMSMKFIGSSTWSKRLKD